MTNYTLRVVNQSSANHSYAVFTQSPTIPSQTNDPQVYANVWATLDAVSAGGSDTITSDGMTVTHAGATPPHTTSSAAPPRDAPIAGGGSDALLHDGATPGAFVTAAPSDFSPTNDFVFGLARPGNAPVPTALASFSPEPNQTFNITPLVKFFVADGLYMTGQIIDASTLSSNHAEIDFSGRPETTATVVQAADGSFSVTYS